ncbi:MAG: CTAG/PCC1 family protein [Candidatus Bathyarchaeota archaeon]|nr:MAG: CTAG/PCC1 family protein [Candidatus Bathyarchaeota archaeon]
MRIYTARFQVSFPSDHLAQTIYQSLKLELNLHVNMSVEDDRITVTFNADSPAKLQALTNSYLRWIATIINVLT